MSVLIRPGFNENFTAEDYDLIKNDSYFQDLETRKTLQIISKEKNDLVESDFTLDDKPTTDCHKYIKDCDNIHALDAWLGKEECSKKRSDILRLITHQIKSLKATKHSRGH